jgi:putative heme-binding domain-containing protein
MDWKKDSLEVANEQARQQMNALQTTLLDEHTPQAERLAIAAQMAKNAAGGQLLISLAATKKLPKEVMQQVSEDIFRNPDQTVRVLAGDYFKRPGQSKVFSINNIARLKPEGTKGKAIFATNCTPCHRIGQQGKDVGPELTSIRNKFDRVGLLDAIINPSAGIVFGYEPWLLTTKGGETLYGFVIADGPTVVVKDPSGYQHVVKAEQITVRKKLDTSLMPDPTTLGLTEKNLSDLAEYLLTVKVE